MPGSRPNRVIQARWETTATDGTPPGSSSDGASNRPCAGTAPNSVKKSPETRVASTRVGAPPPTIVKSKLPKAARENASASAPTSRSRTHSGWLRGKK